MHHLSIQTIQSWERFYRANFVNCLSGFKAANLIATINEQGQPNLAIFSSVIHLGSDPAMIGYINRPLAAAPHTIQNIKATGVYTINHVSSAIAAKAHQTSAKYDQEINEFDAVGLSTEFIHPIKAPFVAESAIKYALILVEIVPITHNNTFLVIGEITDVFINESVVLEDGFIDLEKADSISCLGLDAYFTTNRLARYGYAKPDVPLKQL